MLIEHIKKHLNEYESKRDWSRGLRASNSGKCTRAIAYQYHGYEPIPLNWRARLVFDLGDMIETQLVDISKNYGLSDLQKECSYGISGVEIKGHVDGILNDMVVDIKSTTTFGFKLAKKGDVGNYLYTMHFYMKALGLSKALLVYYCKEQSDLHEVPLYFKESVWEKVKESFARVIASSKNDLPDRGYFPSATGKLPWQCSYCSFVKHCYPNYELTFDDAGKPQLFIKGDNYELGFNA